MYPVVLFHFSERDAELIKLGLIRICLAVVEKSVVVRVRAENFVRMFDRAKILLGSRQYFAHVAHQPITVFTISAMKFLDEVQVAQVPAIKHDVIVPPHFGNAINRKASQLIETHAEIEHDERNDHRVNDRPSNEVLRTISDQPAEEAPLQLLVRGLDRAFKLDALAFNLKEYFVFLLLNRRSQFIFKRGHAGKDV